MMGLNMILSSAQIIKTVTLMLKFKSLSKETQEAEAAMLSRSLPMKHMKKTMQLSKFPETGMLRNAVEINVMDIEENNSTPNQEEPVKIGTLKAHINTKMAKKVMKKTSAETQVETAEAYGVTLLTQNKDGKIANQLLT